jgi:hypothetical protein
VKIPAETTRMIEEAVFAGGYWLSLVETSTRLDNDRIERAYALKATVNYHGIPLAVTVPLGTTAVIEYLIEVLTRARPMVEESQTDFDTEFLGEPHVTVKGGLNVEPVRSEPEELGDEDVPF